MQEQPNKITVNDYGDNLKSLGYVQTNGKTVRVGVMLPGGEPAIAKPEVEETITVVDEYGALKVNGNALCNGQSVTVPAGQDVTFEVVGKCPVAYRCVYHTTKP